MRCLTLVPLLALAACGGGETQNKARAAAASLQPGQYEVTAEVTQFHKADQGMPKINTPVGTRTTRSICVASGTTPPPELFADEGIDCRTGEGAFVRSGSINLTLACTRAGLNGEMGYTLSGTFDDQGFQADRQFTTRLVSDGDVVITSRLQGRRTGACSAPPAPAGNSQAK